MKFCGNNLKTISCLAFTLAEFLIVLGILGVIAELTIPILLSDFKDKAAVVGLKHSSAVFQQALSLAIVNEGDIENWYSGADSAAASAAINSILSKYLKIAVNCGSTGTECSPASYSYLNPSLGSIPAVNFANYSRILLADGTTVLFVGIPSGGYLSSITIYFDVNGLKTPNAVGKDLFIFDFYSKSSVATTPAYYKKPQVLIPVAPSTDNVLSNNCNPSITGFEGTGWGCTPWVYYKENRDYLHCDDLNWDTKTSCD